MKVLLLEHISNLGAFGEEVNVKNGFARNYLLPQGKVLRATSENRKIFDEGRTELERIATGRLKGAERRAAELNGRTVVILARVSEGGNLYGSVGTVEITRALADAGVEVHKSEIRLPEGVIRSVGEYQVDVQLYAGVMRTVKVIVEAE